MEEGIAHLFLVSRSTSKLKAMVEKRISKKKGIAAATGAHDKQKAKFYEAIVQALITHFSSSPSWSTMLKTVIIASPGFTKDGFYQYLKASSENPQNPKGGVGSFLKHCIEKCIVAHSSSGFKHSLQEVLQNRQVQDRIKDLAVFEEAVSLDKFFEALAVNPNVVCYGKKSCDYAMENNAVQTLLVSDKLFRAKNVATRQSYVALVDLAERMGVSTMIFSSMNPSGERKHNLITMIVV